VKQIAIVKGEAKEEGEKEDHRPVQVPNTISKVEDKAVMQLFQADNVRE